MGVCVVTMRDSKEEMSRRRARLRWRCRRGMSEIDQLLIGWLERFWTGADETERALFEDLLDCEDDVLWAWLSGRMCPESEAHAALVRSIRDTAVARN